MKTDQIEKEIRGAEPGTQVRSNAPMGEFCSFKTGGVAALLIEPESPEALGNVLRILHRQEFPVFIMGNGSNLLVKDGGFPGAIVKIGERMSAVEIQGTKVRAQAGALLSCIANRALEAGLTGFEFAAGIPGSIGGAAFMNAGAYDGEMKQAVEEVTVLSRDGSRFYTLRRDELEYGYRHSVLMETGDIVTEVLLRLEAGSRERIRAKMKELAARRAAKQPLQYPSAGSFFKRPPGHFAGGLIQDANLKGLKIGGARVSPLHAGFIINEGGASAADILNLMEAVRNTVYDRFGVWLEPEVRIIGIDSDEI